MRPPGICWKIWGEGDEHELRPAGGVDAEGKHRGQDGEARQQGGQGVQYGGHARVAEDVLALFHIAAVDEHARAVDGQGEEGLSHGVIDGAEQPKAAVGIVHQVVEVGHQVELHALHGTGKGEGADGQHYQQGQQAEHHGLVDLLHAVFQAAAADQHTKHHHDAHEQKLNSYVALHGAESGFHTGGIQAPEFAGSHLEEVKQQPAGDGGVEHHQQVIARHAEPAVPVPLAPLGLQDLKGGQDALPAGPAHGKLHGHDGQAHDDQEQQIDQHKGRAAVLPHDVGEPPDVAQADGAPGRDEHKAQPGRKGLSLFHNCIPSLDQPPHARHYTHNSGFWKVCQSKAARNPCVMAERVRFKANQEPRPAG